MPPPEAPSRSAPPTAQAPAQGALEYLTFSLGAEYGIDVQNVREIRAYEAPTRVPGAAPWLCGVLQLRGAAVPVVDLRARLGMQAAAYGASTVALVVDRGGASTALVVDAVHDVTTLADDAIQTPASQLPGLRTGYLHGIATVPGEDSPRTLLLLDTDRLLARSDAPQPATCC